MTNFRVASIDSSYAQVLCDLGKRLFADTFGPDNEHANMEAYLAETYSKELQLKELNDPTWHTFMSFDENDVPVGFAQIRQTEKVYDFIGDNDAIELHRIYVDKSCAGKDVGKLLIDTCLQKAQDLNKQTMWLGVWEFNPHAIKFYERQGFHKIGTHIFKVGNQEDTDNVMIKKL